jgi:hypothetical protein
MPKNLPIGVDDFAKLSDRENNYLFADKTLFIKEMIDDKSEAILITRPRRWGKTLMMSTLHHFLSAEVIGQPTRNLFDDLAIAQVDDGRYLAHQGQYPVIFFSFKDIKEQTFAGALSKVETLIQELFRQHKYLRKSENLDEDDVRLFSSYLNGETTQQGLENALKVLSELLHKHCSKRVYILIDEYDSPLNNAYGRYFNEMSDFMKNMLSTALKGNPYLKKGIMTGVLRISKDSMLSGLNNLKVFTVLDEEYKQFFGFTEKELDALFADQELEKDEEKIRGWYNGYQVGGLTLYNPWSINNVLQSRGRLRAYWVNTGDDSLLRTLLQQASPDIKEKFLTLLEGRSIEGFINESIRFEHLDEMRRDEASIWTLLVYTGYLNVPVASLSW